jgi:hypothetical protein
VVTCARQPTGLSKSAVSLNSSTGTTGDGLTRRSPGKPRTKPISARSRRLQQRRHKTMAERCCEFVDSRLRRCPPDRASAVPYGQAGKNALRFPHLAHRSAAVHKLHSTAATSRIDFDSGKGETFSRLWALAYFSRNLSKRPAPSQRVELSRSPTTQQLALLAHPKLLRTASRSRLRLQSRRGAGKASGPFASFLNPADSPVCRGRLISLAIAG